MKLQQLKYFVAVFEEGSFSAAAVRVNATQSGLSMHVRQLEDRHGVVLLERGSTGVTPTEAGRAFYGRALAVLRAAAEAQDLLATLSGTETGHVRAGLMPSFTGSILAPVLLRQSTRHPHVRVDVQEAYSANLMAGVIDGALDFAVVPAGQADAALEVQILGEDAECLVRAAGAPAATGRLREVAPLRLVLPTVANARRPRIDRYLAVNGIEVAETIELDAMLGTLDLVATSDWSAILPGILSRPDRGGALRRFVPLADPPMSVSYMLVTHKARPLGRAARGFVDLLGAELDLALSEDSHPEP